jgi:hypothetical protein
LLSASASAVWFTAAVSVSRTPVKPALHAALAKAPGTVVAHSARSAGTGCVQAG